MSTAPLRAAMVPVSRQMRAYFAPVNRESETPTIFDPGLCGAFVLDAPPVPWLDLGWVENFERWYDTPTKIVRAGAKGLAAGQFRGPLILPLVLSGDHHQLTTGQTERSTASGLDR